MKELWDLYSADRSPLGRSHVRGEELPEGCFHLVVHVWVRNGRGQYLISQRAETRPTFPLMWECTGGSAVQGETSLQGALREAREEMGVALEAGKGRVLFSLVRERMDGKWIGNIADVWLFEYEGEADLSAADGEVRAVKWADKQEIAAMLESGEMVDTLAYFLERLEFN